MVYQASQASIYNQGVDCTRCLDTLPAATSAAQPPKAKCETATAPIASNPSYTCDLPWLVGSRIDTGCGTVLGRNLLLQTPRDEHTAANRPTEVSYPT